MDDELADEDLDGGVEDLSIPGTGKVGDEEGENGDGDEHEVPL